MKRIICLCLVALFTLFLNTNADAPASPFADANQAEIEYGQGVHAFYGGKYKDAVDILQGLEKRESKDPRVYYYLALSSLRLKQNKEEADSYFEKAAELEFNGHSLRDYDIPETLRRIQGTERKTIEMFRGAALAKYQAEQKRLDEIKYSERRKADSQLVGSYTKPEAKHDAAVLQELSKASSANTVTLQNPLDLSSRENPFGAGPVDPINPPREVKAVVPKKAITKKTAVAVEDTLTDLKPDNEKTADDSFDDEEVAVEKPKPVKKPSKTEPAADEDENPFEQGRVKTKSADDKEPSAEDSADAEEEENVGKSVTNSDRNNSGAVAKSLGRSLSELFKKGKKSDKEGEEQAKDGSEKEAKPVAKKVKKEVTDEDSEETEESEDEEK